MAGRQISEREALRRLFYDDDSYEIIKELMNATKSHIHTTSHTTSSSTTTTIGGYYFGTTSSGTVHLSTPPAPMSIELNDIAVINCEGGTSQLVIEQIYIYIKSVLKAKEISKFDISNLVAQYDPRVYHHLEYPDVVFSGVEWEGMTTIRKALKFFEARLEYQADRFCKETEDETQGEFFSPDQKLAKSIE